MVRLFWIIGVWVLATPFYSEPVKAHPNDFGWAWPGNQIEVSIRTGVEGIANYVVLVPLKDEIITAAKLAIDEWNRSGMNFEIVLRVDDNKANVAQYNNQVHEIGWANLGFVVKTEDGRWGTIDGQCTGCGDVGPDPEADIYVNSNAAIQFIRSLMRGFEERELFIEALRVTLLHELGHFLGLHHPWEATVISVPHDDACKATIMQYEPCQPSHITDADKEAVRKKYPQTKFLHTVAPSLTIDGKTSSTKKQLETFRFEGKGFTPNSATFINPYIVPSCTGY